MALVLQDTLLTHQDWRLSDSSVPGLQRGAVPAGAGATWTRVHLRQSSWGPGPLLETEACLQAPLLHSQSTDVVGPVRSPRALDLQVVSEHWPRLRGTRCLSP